LDCSEAASRQTFEVFYLVPEGENFASLKKPGQVRCILEKAGAELRHKDEQGAWGEGNGDPHWGGCNGSGIMEIGDRL
jgi:hypothetical protein